MSNFFDILDSNLECNIHDFQDLMEDVEFVHCVRDEDEFYSLQSDPTVKDVFSEFEASFEIDNPLYKIHGKHDNSFIIRVQRTSNDCVGWYLDSNSDQPCSLEDFDITPLPSMPIQWVTDNKDTFFNYETVSKGKIVGVEKDNPQKVLEALFENCII